MAKHSDDESVHHLTDGEDEGIEAFEATRASDEGSLRGPTPPRLPRLRRVRQQWQEEFPYHWNADDLVTRRDTLRFIVAGSGALFLASAAVALAGTLSAPTVRRLIPVATLGEIPVNGSKVFHYPDTFADGIVVNLPGRGMVAYSDVCTHLSCAVLYTPENQQFYCPCHEGHFDAYTGEVLGGPPTRPLPNIELTVNGDTIYAVKEE